VVLKALNSDGLESRQSDFKGDSSDLDSLILDPA
jgi:hypothetical protein